MTAQPILLAEDNAHDAMLFQRQLDETKILNPLQVVNDGEQVVDYLNGNGQYADRHLYPLPIVLFLDLRMPKLSGYQILSYIRSDPFHRKLPVVVLSGMSELKSVTEAYRHGATSFLLKPLNSTDLLQNLHGITTVRSTDNGLRLEPLPETPNAARFPYTPADFKPS